VPFGRVNVILVVVGLLHVQLVHFVHKIIRGASIHRVGEGVPMHGLNSHGDLLLGELSIIAETKEPPLKTFEAL
jgi:hypothetical protein